MFVVVTLRYKMECHNFHKHSQSSLTSGRVLNQTENVLLSTSTVSFTVIFSTRRKIDDIKSQKKHGFISFLLKTKI